MLGLIFTTIIVVCSSTPPQFVPPDGAYFQITNSYSKRCIYNRAAMDLPVSSSLVDDLLFNAINSEVCDKKYADQYWRLEQHPSDAGWYQIINKHTNKCIYAATDNSFAVTNSDVCSKRLSNQYWRFEASGNDKNSFQIINKWTNKCIYAATDGRFDADGRVDDKWDDQYWRFKLEPFIFKRVDFDLDIEPSSRPFVVGESICDNTEGGNEPQTMETTVSKTLSQTRSFSNTAGFGVEVGMTFKTGVPLIAEAEASVSISASYEHTWGTEETTERTFEATLSVTCGAGEKLKKQCVVQEGKLNVPYAMVFETTETKKEFKSEGIWTGTQGYDFACKFVAF